MDLITTSVVFGQSPPANTIVHNASVSLTNRSPSEPVHLVQYDDTLPMVAVALTSNGQPYTVPSGAAVNVRLAKPDGTYVYNPAYGVSTDGQTVYIAITVQMTVCAGKVAPIIEVVLDGDVAGTGFFVLDIDPNPIPEDAIASTDEYKTIQKLAGQVQQAAQVITDNVEGIQYVQQNSAALTAVAQNASNISAVGGSIDNVNTVAGNLTPIQTAANNISTIQQAPAAATNAGASATLAQSWAVGGTGTREGENTNNAKYWSQISEQAAENFLGWYSDYNSLLSAHPSGQNGQYAIVGVNIYLWNASQSDWVPMASPAKYISIVGQLSNDPTNFDMPYAGTAIVHQDQKTVDLFFSAGVISGPTSRTSSFSYLTMSQILSQIGATALQLDNDGIGSLVWAYKASGVFPASSMGYNGYKLWINEGSDPAGTVGVTGGLGRIFDSTNANGVYNFTDASIINSGDYYWFIVKGAKML